MILHENRDGNPNICIVCVCFFLNLLYLFIVIFFIYIASSVYLNIFISLLHTLYHIICIYMYIYIYIFNTLLRCLYFLPYLFTIMRYSLFFLNVFCYCGSWTHIHQALIVGKIAELNWIYIPSGIYIFFHLKEQRCLIILPT